MKDLERDLVALLDEKFHEVRVVPAVPERVLRRTRRRQLVTAATLGTAAVLLAGASILGVKTLLDANRHIPADRTQTMTVDGVTVTFPRGWSLLPCDQLSPESPCGGPDAVVLILSNDETVTSGDLGCPVEDGTFTETVFVQIQELPLATEGPSTARWPVEPSPSAIDVKDPCFVGWSFSRAGWTAAGRTFDGLVAFAPGATEDDRTALLDAFVGMSFGQSTLRSKEDPLTTGIAAGRRWRLLLSESDAPLTLELLFGERSVGFGFPRSDQPRPIEFASHVFGRGQKATAVVFGPVTKDAVRVSVAGTRNEARIIELGPESDYNVFVLKIAASVGAEVIVRVEDAQGLISREPLTIRPGG